jgi:enoyl-CoA hydratase
MSEPSVPASPLPSTPAVELVRCSRDGAVAVLTIDRPKALNALDAATLAALSRQIDALDGDASVRAVILTGAGDKAFVAGADIAALRDMGHGQALEFSRFGGGVFRRLEQLRVPVIAAVNGFALGGGLELALACDVILASTKAKFGLPEVTLGVVPGFGGTQRLARAIGANAARLWVLSGDVFPADEALRLGLAYSLHDPAELCDAAMTLARKIASRGPLAVAEAKAVLDAGPDMPLDAAVELESQAFARCFQTADQREGMDAFLGKRTAQFQGS